MPIEQLTRDMKKEERRVLEGALAPRGFGYLRKSLLLGLAGALTCAVLIAVVITRGPLPVAGVLAGVLGAAGLVSLYLALASAHGFLHWRKVQEHFGAHGAPEIRHALKDGRVRVKRVSATAVVALEESEDEGPGFLFDLDDGTVLFLKGQVYSFPRDDSPWPNSAFEIVRTVPKNRWIGVFCAGEALLAVRTIDASVLPEAVVWSEREDVLQGSLDEVVRRVTESD